MKKRKILVVWSGPEHGTSANLFKALVGELQKEHWVLIAPNGTTQGSRLKKILNHIACDLTRWPKLFVADSIILHSYAALSLPTVLLAKALSRRIVVVLWDAYPITIDGKPIGGLYRKCFDRLEHFVVSLSTRVVVPTEDFTAFVDHADVRILPLWPSLPIGAVKARRSLVPHQPIRLAFVGQAGLTRGLPEAVMRLGRESSTEFELHLFSPKSPETDLGALAPNVRVVQRGFLDRSALIEALGEMDFGLVSLHPKMGQPGFPSKVFDYIAAGLPVVYTGRPMPAFSNLLVRTGVGFALGDAPVNWEAILASTEATMPASVQAFAAETCLSAEKLQRAFFQPAGQ